MWLCPKRWRAQCAKVVVATSRGRHPGSLRERSDRNALRDPFRNVSYQHKSHYRLTAARLQRSPDAKRNKGEKQPRRWRPSRRSNRSKIRWHWRRCRKMPRRRSAATGNGGIGPAPTLRRMAAGPRNSAMQIKQKRARSPLAHRKRQSTRSALYDASTQDNPPGQPLR